MSQSSYKAQFEYSLSYDEIDAIVRAKKNGNAAEVMILDVRDAYERKANGYIPYSINIPIPEIRDLQKMSNTAFQKRYGVNKPQKTDPIVLYCSKSQRSAFVNELLRNDGYKVVTYIREGFEGWHKRQNAQLDDDL
ncbi:unnamed protein product [Phytomonas sp. Hart1]|nr:unnamed protein product [Phytomonas sp. Hart1]|eukprot:CCW66735.1 unnamed protein product [Phytomonas sp. isolate Hart1]